jgi:ferritin-like metal-binding protein YciE
MMPKTIRDQVVSYLTDVHSIEVQALAQMRKAPDIAGDERVAAVFRQHEKETEDHEQKVRLRLEELDAKPSLLKDLLGKATGGAFVLFARSQPDTPGKLVAHAFSYEHMEVAAYELLIRVGERVGDAPTVAVARVIRAQEQRMSERVAGCFDIAVDASLRDIAPGDLPEQVNKYLADAHALEAQAIELLSRSEKIGGDAQLQEVYREHLEESREHQRLLEERLAARGGRPAAFKDAALRLGAVNWGLFFQSQPDTPAKLAGFAYAFEHLEIAGYELLKRVAERAGDTETVDLAALIGEQERAAARRVAEGFDVAIEASLRDLGVAVGSR